MYFYRSQGLKGHSIPNIQWDPANINKIINEGEVLNMAKDDENKDIFIGPTYCLNIYYKFANKPNMDWKSLHSKEREDDYI